MLRAHADEIDVVHARRTLQLLEEALSQSIEDRELDWNNFLLGCPNCNSVKGDADVADESALWPDRHNTMLALAYSRGGFVRVAEELNDELQQRARRRRGPRRRCVATRSNHSTALQKLAAS